VEQRGVQNTAIELAINNNYTTQAGDTDSVVLRGGLH